MSATSARHRGERLHCADSGPSRPCPERGGSTLTGHLLHAKIVDARGTILTEVVCTRHIVLSFGRVQERANPGSRCVRSSRNPFVNFRGQARIFEMKARRYSPHTIKVLFGASGNQCASPGCTNPVIAPGTPVSDAAVVAQICHIYAASDNGPRGKPGLTEAERNSPDNLILMCGHHHPLVDKQWETYPADLLKAWKQTHEAKFQQGTAEALKLQESMQQMGFLRTYSDQQIAAEIEAIRQARFINGYPAGQKAAELAERIERTELVGGSSKIRAKGLAWCARLLCQPKTLDRARELLKKSKALAETGEAWLAEAFIVARSPEPWPFSASSWWFSG
jgi:hypothetical protein